MAENNNERIPLSVPWICGNEWTYVKECLDTGWVSSVGSFVDRFERQFTEIVGSEYAVACVNGTSALHIALKLAGVQPGDEVIAPTLTFIASINAINYCGARPVFFDCDEYYNIDEAAVVHFLKNEIDVVRGRVINRSTGARIAAVLPVHVFGNAASFSELGRLCRELKLPIVEDAAEALGTKYISGEFSAKSPGAVGTIGCFSFNGNKIVTTGGGGMIVTSDEKLAIQARHLTTQAKSDAIRFVHDEVGFNYRLTNIAAAIGVAQLEKLPAFLSAKRKLFNRYQEAFAGVPGLYLAPPPTYAANNLWMFALQITKSTFGRDREEVLDALGKKGIEVRPVWHLNHLQLPYRDCQQVEISNAYTLADLTLNIPCSTSLSEAQQERVIQAIAELGRH